MDRAMLYERIFLTTVREVIMECNLSGTIGMGTLTVPLWQQLMVSAKKNFAWHNGQTRTMDPMDLTERAGQGWLVK